MSDLEDVARRLQPAALERGLTVATAESCTGGLVGHAITMVPGSSAYFLGGVIAYADTVKSTLLGVSDEMLQHHGAVSAQVARAMAEGARADTGAVLAVAVTGIAGPDGGSEAKPVGLTYIAAAGPDGVDVRRHTWSGDRARNTLDSAHAALTLLLEVAERLPRTAG
jgi:PncC family amidohydrolase